MKNTLLRLYGKCNFRCKLCMAETFNENEKRPSLARLKEQILQAERDGTQELDIGGGEPTTYGPLLDVLRFAYDRKISCALCTNGFRFSDPAYVEQFAGFKPLGIKISFHSHKKNVFDFTTGIPGSFENIMKAIANIRERLRAYPRSKKSYLLANIVVTRYNYRDLPAIVAFLRAQNVFVVKLSQLVLSGSVYAHPDLLISPGKIQPYLEEAVAYLKRNRLSRYYIDKFPVCMLESEHRHFVPLNDTNNHVKLRTCASCAHDKKCCGLSKLALMARYGRRLRDHRRLFPQGFFTERDTAFLNKL
ncbi:MAG: radical SAM protein [Deltaproteobacteria bacterium]